MKTILVSCAAALLLAGCDRYAGPTQVSGTVEDSHTGQAVPNAIVQVLGSSTSASGGGTSGGLTTHTDAQGHFALSFEASAHELYQLQAYSASGYTPLGTPYVDGGRQTDNVTVKVSAPAWVKINCVDDPPLGKVGLTTWGYDYGANGISDVQNVGPGNYSFVRPTASYTSDRKVNWEVLDAQGHTVEGKIPFSTAGFDTATVTIHF